MIDIFGELLEGAAPYNPAVVCRRVGGTRTTLGDSAPLAGDSSSRLGLRPVARTALCAVVARGPLV